MFARIGPRIGGMFGKQGQAAFGGGGVEAVVEFLRQCVVEFERTQFALYGGDVVQYLALCVENIEAAQVRNIGHGREVVLEVHGFPLQGRAV